MAEQSDKSFTAQNFSSLPLKALIGAPLKATADANAMVAQAQTNFLLSTCFEKQDNDSKVLKPIMVHFRLERKVLGPDGTLKKKPVEMVFSIPLMSLIPINSLAVESLKVSFEMEVKSSIEISKETAEDSKKNVEDGLSGAYKSHQFTTEMYGTLNSASSEKSKSVARYEIDLTAGQLPLPKGVTTILDIFIKNMAPIPTEDKE